MAFGGHPTLENDLDAAWELSADGSDAHGANDLTNNNGVTFVAKGGGAPANMPATVASFAAASVQSLSHTGIGFSSSDDFTFVLWYKQPATTQPYLFGRMDSGAGNSDYGLYLDGGGSRWWLGDSGGPGVNFVNFNNAVDDVWRLIIATWTAADSKARVSVDNGSEAVSSALPAWTTASGGTIKFALGSAGGYTGGQLYNGLQSSALVYSRVLTSDERTDLWNDGDGLFYGTGDSTPEPIIYRGRTAKYFYWDI